jgi:hypothetical protein
MKLVITYFDFAACSLGDEAVLTMASLGSLQKIIITCDPIGNRGIIQLIKLDLPNLRAFSMENTTTVDSIKLFTKRPLNFLVKIGHNYQKNFNYHLQAKKLIPLSNFEKIRNLSMLFDQIDKHAFLELGLLAKSELPFDLNEQKQQFSLILNRFTTERKNPSEDLIPLKTINALEKILTLICTPDIFEGNLLIS